MKLDPLSLLSILVVTLLTFAHAQEFVFVSDRVYRSLQAYDGYFWRQNDLFLYRNGSELRLTRTPELAEYDPTPTASGSRVAYAVKPTDEPPGSGHWDFRWQYRVIETPLGREVARWDMPNAETLALTRPAGGFIIRWLDEDTFFAQVPDAEWNWEVHQFSISTGEHQFVTRGYGIALSPDKRWLATERNGISYVLELSTGQEIALAAGEPLGWLDAQHLFVARPDALYLVELETERETQLFNYYGLYYSFTVSPDAKHYAFTLHQDDSWYVFILDNAHHEVLSYSYPNHVEQPDWLDSERLVFGLMASDNSMIVLLDVRGNDPILVDSQGFDYGARALRTGP